MDNQLRVTGGPPSSPPKRLCFSETSEGSAKKNKTSPPLSLSFGSSGGASASLPTPPVLETSASSNNADLHLNPSIKQHHGLDTMCTPPGTPRSTSDGTPHPL